MRHSGWARAAANGLEIGVAHLGGQGPDGALADRVAVDRQDRRHLGGGAGEERLVGDVELGPVDLALPRLTESVSRNSVSSVARVTPSRMLLVTGGVMGRSSRTRKSV